MNSARYQNTVNYLVPALLLGYLVFCFAPILFSSRSSGVKEIFPFSPFILYTTVPATIDQYDVLLDPKAEQPSYLFLGNTSFNKLEKKYLSAYFKHLAVPTDLRIHDLPPAILKKFPMDTNSVLVRIHGDVLEAAVHNHYQVENIGKVK